MITTESGDHSEWVLEPVKVVVKQCKPLVGFDDKDQAEMALDNDFKNRIKLFNSK